jgi:hypothetical protein
MLISTSKRFILLSPTKVASTSAGGLLSQFCDIRIGTPAFGKHEHIDLVRRRFDWIFEKEPFETFKIFLLFRAPIERAVSLYTSHLKPAFDEAPTSTKGMPIDVFVSQWLPRNTWMSLPQFLHGMLSERGFVVDYLLRQECLRNDLLAALSLVGVIPRVDNLTRSNESPPGVDKDHIRDQLRARLRDLYAVDQYLFDNYCGRPTTAAEKHNISEWIYRYYGGEMHKEKIAKQIVERMSHNV